MNKLGFYINLTRLTAAAYDRIDYHEWSGSLVQMNEPDTAAPTVTT